MPTDPLPKQQPHSMGRLRGGYLRGVHIDLDGNIPTELHGDTNAWFRWLAAMAMTDARVRIVDVKKV